MQGGGHPHLSRRNSRGVAPLVSTMLLISITVFAFAIVWGVTNSYLSNQRLGPLQQIRERITIEDAYFFENATGKYIGVYIRNSGKVEFIADSVGVNGSILANSSPKSLTLLVGQGGWMNASLAWSSGENYLVSVTSQRGSRVESSVLVT